MRCSFSTSDEWKLFRTRRIGSSIIGLFCLHLMCSDQQTASAACQKTEHSSLTLLPATQRKYGKRYFQRVSSIYAHNPFAYPQACMRQWIEIFSGRCQQILSCMHASNNLCFEMRWFVSFFLDYILALITYKSCSENELSQDVSRIYRFSPKVDSYGNLVLRS